MTTALVVIALLLLLSFGLVFLAVARDTEVVREPSEFELACREFNDSLIQLQIAFADALTPAFRRAVEALNAFHAALASNRERQS